MALPDHSPQRPFARPGSPLRPFVTGSSDRSFPPPFAPRQMLPPSPQHYQHRYSQPPPPPPALLNQSYAQQADAPGPPPAPKRPGSSMSISAMLGSDADRILRDPPPQHNTNPAGSMSLVALMSPPQQGPRMSNGSYPYQQRSRTPDRQSHPHTFGPRQYRSSSGTMMQRPHTFEDPRPPPAGPLLQPFGQPHQPPPLPMAQTWGGDAAERARRTSLSGILQRPGSQPQSAVSFTESTSLPQNLHWGDPPSVSGDGALLNEPSFVATGGPRLNAVETSTIGFPSSNGASAYDTRPPAFGGSRLSSLLPDHEFTTPQHIEPRSSQPVSPERQRSVMDASDQRNFGGLLNGPSNGPQNEPQAMARQDSSQSQSDRLSDRVDRNLPRFFSPFANSYGQNHPPSASVPPDEQHRKGSDELSQHRAILSAVSESKRGRFSPLPQAVQGAQAQTPMPDAGIKTEHGKVFAGLGGGIGTNSTSITPNPTGLSSSPFKKDDGLPRLSEDNLMKVSRSQPGTNKRSRKLKDETLRASSEAGGLTNGKGTKRPKQHHHHHLHYKVDKVDLDDLNAPLNAPRRHTPVATHGAGRRTSTPGVGSNNVHHHHHRHIHHHHHHHIPAQSQAANSKARPVAKISHILKSVSSNPRRHLGSYLYSPIIAVKDDLTSVATKLDVSIQPNTFPVFDGPEFVNSTYTVRVPRQWLRHPEREAIRAERFLWGVGIYTDDSDPIAAAMHAGFIQTAFGETVDIAHIEEVSKIYDPVIDGGQENVPESPMPVPPDKDLHITLLVLPQLERYQGRGRFGLVSRSWGERDGEAKGAPHDGVSFMVLNAKLVDEARNVGLGRTAADRRRKISADLADRDKMRKRLEERQPMKKDKEK